MSHRQYEIHADDISNEVESWPEWYSMTPLERWNQSLVLWQFFLRVGGSLDPEPDSQSPFDPYLERGQVPADGGAGLRVLRRGRI